MLKFTIKNGFSNDFFTDLSPINKMETYRKHDLDFWEKHRRPNCVPVSSNTVQPPLSKACVNSPILDNPHSVSSEICRFHFESSGPPKIRCRPCMKMEHSELQIPVPSPKLNFLIDLKLSKITYTVHTP